MACRLSGEGQAWSSEGTTIDLTRRGALIECPAPRQPEQAPREGDTLTVEIALPRGPVEQRCFRGRAKVVRLVRATGGVLRLAVEFYRLQFAPWRLRSEAAAGGVGVDRLEAAAWGRP